jgi:SpoVK/Ycf46/Vps4 family AAA+-type ATPase
VKSMRFDDSIYKAAGLNPLPLNLSPAMAQVLAAGLRKTNGVMHNLTMTTAIDASNKFQNAADLAYMQITSGAMSYDEAIRAAIKDVASQGLSTINFAGGRTDQLDVAMRRAVLTGVNQTTGNLTIARADELGCDLVQTSAHIGARPEHEEWQGQVFSRSGTDPDYPDFVSSTGYGTGEGLLGWNCRHTFFPFFKGISENAYSEATLDDYADKTVTYNGRDMTAYEATQKQRAIEREIRKAKREAGGLEAAGQENAPEIARVKDLQARLREFVKQTGLQRQPVRESVSGASR